MTSSINRNLPHTQLLGIAQLRRHQSSIVELRPLQANHGEIACRILSDQCGRHVPPVRQRHRDARRLMHDVAIG